MNATLTADQSADFMSHKLRCEKPFSYWRFGDGFLECVAGKRGGTRDGEEYSGPLAAQLMRCWNAILEGRDVYLGDWLSASFDSSSEANRYTEQYAELVRGASVNWLHFEALLLMRESEALADFYRTVRNDSRRKLFMGPAVNMGVAGLLRADFLETPMRHLFLDVKKLTDELLRHKFDVLLFGAGMAGNIPAVNCWQEHPERTYISLGSALDPLFRGRSRAQQLPAAHAWRMFETPLHLVHLVHR